MARKSSTGALALVVLLALGGCYKGDSDRLRKELATVQQENEALKKKIELLSGTVKQLADLQVLNQNAEQKREETAKPDEKKSE